MIRPAGSPPSEDSGMRRMRGNLRRFVAFRVLFNARFYYPVFAILFLDLGLTAEQFALANALWAITIVTLEVPSGALADLLGRRNLMVLGTALMIAEMLLLLVAAAVGGAWTLGLVLANRVLSGAAEACVSGADEALAYDSMAQLGRQSEWPALLEKLMRRQSVAFVISSILGALAYDGRTIQGVLGWFGGAIPVSTIHTLPIWLTLGTACAALLVVLGMKEPGVAHERHASPGAALRQMLSAGRWILATPAALVLIAAALVCDSAIRIFLTFTSSYYRLIQLPEATFGLWGSGFALLGFFMATPARRITAAWGSGRTLVLIGLLVLAGLCGLSLALPVIGLLFVIPLGMAFFMLNFVVSSGLNQVVDAEHRATVLSFKGLALNLAYGALGIGFGAALAWNTGRLPAGGDTATVAFAASLPWLAAWFAFALVCLFLFSRWVTRPR